MSVERPQSWKILRPTPNASEYSNPMHDMESKRIIELDKEPYVREIKVLSVHVKDGMLEADVEFETGGTEYALLKISNLRTLIMQDEPALEIVETRN